MDKAAFSLAYQDALRAFMARPDEDLRQAAYDLGRQALESQIGIMELAQLHAQAAGAVGAVPVTSALLLSSEFFAEAAGPFEMELRGYREALARNEALLLQAQRVESLGLMVGGIVHDFNNLLGIIHGYAELALEDKAVAGAPELRLTLEEVSRASERAAALTKQLLAFTRKQEPEPQALSLNKVLEDSAKLLQRILGPGLELKLQPAANLSLVKADPTQLAQVLMNLAINARDAMPKGGQIVLATANVTMTEGAQGLPAGDYASLSVTDSGTGMDAATQARIFEPFFTTKAPGKGTGLGLATVFSIVKQCQGGLQVRSAPGKGSTFTVLLPAASAPSEAAGAADLPRLGADPALRGKEPLLLVENDDAIRHLGRTLLSQAGYQVLEAANGAQAIDLASRHPGLNLLVTDMDMPGMSGLDVYRRLARQKPGLRVLYVSGSMEGLENEKLSLGAGRSFLAKPYLAKELLQQVRSLLDMPQP